MELRSVVQVVEGGEHEVVVALSRVTKRFRLNLYHVMFWRRCMHYRSMLELLRLEFSSFGFHAVRTLKISELRPALVLRLFSKACLLQ